ncbi:hypothetical protein EBR66_07615 [bacterium]|nr:hypothetical protein [bacterium]
MSFDKFIQTRTIAKSTLIPAGANFTFPTYSLSSYIDFETDGYLVGIHFMVAHNANALAVGSILADKPCGAILAKVSGDVLNIPAGGDITNYSGAQILISHLDFPSNTGTTTDANHGGRQTTIAYDADSKRIPIRSNDRLGVYLCANSDASDTNFAYTLTAYFVRT